MNFFKINFRCIFFKIQRKVTEQTAAEAAVEVVLQHMMQHVKNIFRRRQHRIGLTVKRKGRCFQMIRGENLVHQYVIQMDADGQHDVCNIRKIYERLKEKDTDGRTPDIVLGSRFMDGSAEFRVGFAKKLAFRLFRRMLHIATGRWIADPTTGLQGLSRKAVLYYSKYNHFDDKYPDTNMIMQMMLLDFKVVEIPAVMHIRTSGKSMHSGLKPIWYMMRMFYSVLAVIFRCKVLKMDAGAGRKDVERKTEKPSKGTANNG